VNICGRSSVQMLALVATAREEPAMGCVLLQGAFTRRAGLRGLQLWLCCGCVATLTAWRCRARRDRRSTELGA
jgi:hypothetical protein